MNELEKLSILTGALVIVIELVILRNLRRHSQLLATHMDRFESSMDKVLADVEEIYGRVCAFEGRKD